MNEVFNPAVGDDPDVEYYSYGAKAHPAPWSAFRQPHRIIQRREGDNDVSVASAMWGRYEGTLVGCTHLEIINWYNRVEFAVDELMGRRRKFNALAFYLAIADNLAAKGF